MFKITPSAWSRTGSPSRRRPGLPRGASCKYHTLLHGIFKQAVRDRVIGVNPASDTELPKVVKPTRRTLTPDGVRALLAADPRPLGPAGPDRDRDRHALGRARRAAARGTSTLRRTHHRRGDHRRGLHSKHSPTGERFVHQALPQGQRTPHHRRQRRAGSRRCHSASPSTASAATTTSSPPARAAATPDLPQHLPHPGLAARRQGRRARLQRPHARPAPRPRLLAPRRRLRPRRLMERMGHARSRPPRSTCTRSPTPTREPRRPRPRPPQATAARLKSRTAP